MRRSNALHDYLTSIGRYPLLSKEEELTLAYRVVKFLKLEQIKADLDPPFSLSDWAEAAGISELELKDSIDTGKAAIQSIWVANLRWVVAIAKRYKTLEVDCDILDLIQAGSEGLYTAIIKFRPELGFKFSTYSYWYIREAISSTVVNDRVVRIPTYIYNQIRKISFAREKLAKHLDRMPTTVEVAEAVGLDPDKVAFVTKIKLHALSLDLKLLDYDSVGNITIADQLEDSNTDLYKNLELRDIEEKIHGELAKLPKLDAEVLRMYYGLNIGRALSINSIAAVLQIKNTEVARIIHSTHKLLKERLDPKWLLSFDEARVSNKEFSITHLTDSLQKKRT